MHDVWIDRGGTFTDCIAHDPSTGALRVAKVLSSKASVADAIRAALDVASGVPVPPCRVRLGTTIATNALLERAGEPTALAITRGFGDALAIGTQARPDLFALAIERPRPLHSAVVEVDARASATGEILARPDPAATARDFASVVARGIESLAIAVLHGYRAAELEQELGELARAAGFSHVTLSHEVAEEIGLLARAETAVADAYLTPLLGRYLATLATELPGSVIHVMQSNGGLTPRERFRGKDAVLSGPAGGVVAVADVARRTGVERLIGFDMGGTSTDVCRIEGGEPERAFETEIAGVHLKTPMLRVHTVAAGGGSICRYAAGRLTVGPTSAGADPGPLVHGRPNARELTLTDVNVALGRVVADRFPLPLEVDRAHAALETIAFALHADGTQRAPLDVAEGFFRIAVESMAEAIRTVSIARGHDPRDDALVAFGGAGGQHACAVARALGIRRIFFHPLAGVLSAFGIGVAPSSWHGEADCGRVALDQSTLDEATRALDRLVDEGRAVLANEGATEERIHTRTSVELRYRGTETGLAVDIARGATAADVREAFDALHERAHGFVRPEHPVELVTARATALADAPPVELPRLDPGAAPAVRTTSTLYLDGVVREVPVRAREAIVPGEELEGPLLVLEATGTLVVEPGFRGTLCEDGLLELVDEAGSAARRDALADGAPDPVLVAVMSHRFSSIAEQMGEVLRRTALSTNIRDRLDYSCAVFDADGGLVANAPHIPVHLGAMGESVRAVLEAHPTSEPGDVFVTNHPDAGGSHLPDITVVTPVHGTSGAPRFVVASRGHHADVGGITPGSMPARSRTLEEEGVVFRAERIVRAGRFDRDAVYARFTEGAWPARRPDDNLADLEAQIAANRTGVALLGTMCARFGDDVVGRYMGHVQDHAARAVSDAIRALPRGEHRFTDALDDGTPIAATLTVGDGVLSVDFAGTGAEHDGNLNAPPAVTIAAVLYVLRCLVGEPIPLNAGCLRPVAIHVPAGSLLAPSPGRAVAGGNVETSQRLVDVLLAALGKAAASQGTMNNLTFGDERTAYYETIGGGAGAGPGFEGGSAVHTHMTNSRLTDAEVLEARFPVRVTELSIRRGSGGAGRWRGGDGIVRELELLAPMRVSILSERRTRAPFGLDGGSPGAVGRNILGGVVRAACDEVELRAGDRIRIETPGGGGYGAAAPE